MGVDEEEDVVERVGEGTDQVEDEDEVDSVDGKLGQADSVELDRADQVEHDVVDWAVDGVDQVEHEAVDWAVDGVDRAGGVDQVVGGDSLDSVGLGRAGVDGVGVVVDGVDRGRVVVEWVLGLVAELDRVAVVVDRA